MADGGDDAPNNQDGGNDKPAPEKRGFNPLAMLISPRTAKVAPKPAAAAPAKPAPAKISAPPEEKASVVSGPLMTVVTRNAFYRDGFRNLIKIAILEAVVIVGLILTLIVYINNSQAQDRYFATTADGRIMQLVPLDQPNLSTAALMSWVASAATEVMTFGYHDYQRRLQQSSRHFTRNGWESFSNALQRVRIIDSVTSLQQVVTAAPLSAPILKQQGVLNGRYRWIIQMPLQVTYRSGSQTRTDNLELNLVVERVSSLENPNGVGIEQWVAVQR
jgi:intracellular multiplication protein IcmL